MELWQEPNTRLALEAQVMGEKRAAVREPGCSAEGLRLHPESERGATGTFSVRHPGCCVEERPGQVMGQDIRLL